MTETRCQRFSLSQNLREVVANGLYMNAIVGDEMSVGIVNFRMPEGPTIANKAHSHGEEVTFQVRGGCTVNLGADPKNSEGAFELEKGAILLMPADQPHSGVNRYDAEGMCLRLNVVTPPRKEYGSKGAAKPYYPAESK